MMLRIVPKRERIDNDIARRLCVSVRQSYGVTQRELSKQTGVSMALIQRIEQGTQRTVAIDVVLVFRKLAEEAAESGLVGGRAMG